MLRASSTPSAASATASTRDEDRLAPRPRHPHHPRLLAIVLATVVTATTLAYRAKLDGDLHNRLTNAGAVAERAGSAVATKRLAPGLALEGIATRFASAPTNLPTKTSSTIQTHGSSTCPSRGYKLPLSRDFLGSTATRHHGANT
jgi:hypothetical protein